MTGLKALDKPRCHRCLADIATFCNKVTAGPKARRKSVNELLIDSVDKFKLKIHVEDTESYMSAVDGLSANTLDVVRVVPIRMKNLNASATAYFGPRSILWLHELHIVMQASDVCECRFQHR